MDEDRKKPAEEESLFQREMEGVRRLRHARRTRSRPPPPPPEPAQRQRDERAVVSELLQTPDDPAAYETGEELLFLRPGFQRRYLERLRRGRYSIRDSLDLHHMNEAAASASLLEFIAHALQRGIGCVRVVHGKGLRSAGKPKLKALTQRLLSRHPAVVAFASCRPSHGGTGAVSVLLRRPRR